VALADQPRDLERAWDLARRCDNHPMYDLIYVAAAERLGIQLVTANGTPRARLVGLDWIVSREQLLLG